MVSACIPMYNDTKDKARQNKGINNNIYQTTTTNFGWWGGCSDIFGKDISSSNTHHGMSMFGLRASLLTVNKSFLPMNLKISMSTNNY